MRTLFPFAAVAVVAALGGCAAQPSADGPLLSEGEQRVCVTGRSICRKPDSATASDVRTISGQSAHDSASPTAQKPLPGQQ